MTKHNQIESDLYYFHKQFGAWRNKTAQGALNILGNPEFVQMRIPEFYQHLADDCGRDFPNIRYVAQYLPLFHEGPRHKKLRKLAAVYLRDRAEAWRDLEDSVVELVAQKLLRPGPLDVVAEIALPVIRKTSIAMGGLEYVTGLSAVFTGSNSLKTIREIDAGFGQLREMGKARFPGDDEDTHGMRIAFSALGAEPLGAAIASSFEKMFKGANGQKIATLDWPAHFPATGLTMAFRECKNAPVDLGGGVSDVKHFEVDLSHFVNEDSANPNHVFGVGDHACLGRGMALSLWGRIVAEMRKNPMRVTYHRSTPTTHKMLDFPSSIHIEVSK